VKVYIQYAALAMKSSVGIVACHHTSGFLFPRPVLSFTKSSLVLDRILFKSQNLSTV